MPKGCLLMSFKNEMKYKVGEILLDGNRLGQISKVIRDGFGYSIWWFYLNKQASSYSEEEIRIFKQELRKYMIARTKRESSNER